MLQFFAWVLQEKLSTDLLNRRQRRIFLTDQDTMDISDDEN